MKHVKMVAAIAMTAMAAFAVVGAGSASATTLEVGGVPRNEAVTIVGSLTSSLLLSATGGGFANTCTVFEIEGTAVSPFTASSVSGSGKTLQFGNCTSEPVTADATGTLEGEHIAGTTNATMRSNGAKVTVPSPFGTLTCTTSHTDLGVLTGTATGNATLHINAVINCGFFLPSAKMEGTTTVTSPVGVGATA
jgi:hypothetical protein